ETVSDAMERDVRVGDALQRLRAESGKWETVLDRSGCQQVPTGLIEAKYTRRLLWPRQSLHTVSFFPNVGFANSPFKSGDRLRFVLFTDLPQPLSSPESTVE
ncbi:MAG TPA: hypothetical protein VD837_10335, partial [Terriglobales bacterium]|nr:hypothetical protein [Terriglobales bacterium]